MKFWLEMYQLNNFYDYLIAKMLSIERSDRKIGVSYQEIVELIDRSKIKTKKYAREVIDDYFFRNLSFKALKARLDAFHDVDFYASFKFTELAPLAPERIEHLFSNFRERNLFFRKFSSFFNATLVLLGQYSRDESIINPKARQSLENLSNRARFLNEKVGLLKLANKKDKKLVVKKNFVQISCLFNLLSQFLQEAIGRAK